MGVGDLIGFHHGLFDGDFIDLSSAVISPILVHISVHGSYPMNYPLYNDTFDTGIF